MYVCMCQGITEDDVARIVRLGPISEDDLATTLGLRDERCCGMCAREIGLLVESVAARFGLTYSASEIRSEATCGS